MKKSKHIFTSESVTEGHPDKVADQISDAILDAILEQDPEGRVACETFVTSGLVFVSGEIKTECYIDIPKIVKNTIREIGYTEPELGFDCQSVGVLTAIKPQSGDIARGVNKDGAGDQGMMFGYACNETPEFMPLPIILAHKLVRKLTYVRKRKILPYLKPDGKSQVSIEYEDEIPQKITALVLSAQHSPKISIKKIREDIYKNVIKNVIPQKLWNDKIQIHINPTGRFVDGGPKADTGLTGRKIIVDTYGGKGSHGGGCFSGKDPSKVDRSASYMARHIAKNIVAANLATECEIQLAYAIGVAEPVSLTIDSFGTGKISDEEIAKKVKKIFPLKPKEIIEYLNLKRPIYKKTAAYGHFGRDEKTFTWEKINKIDELR
ncbi:MAG: methionine adenosyltransferase [Candidatus Cloacimonetes bacterium]|nr:methionine adenosyltransferase [Candidatus Cloacimonadota bacterium]